MHGDEPKGVYVAQRLVEALSQHSFDWTVCVVPVVNPDGYALRRRRNAAGVDLNRNFPTLDWTPSSRRSRYYSGSAPASEPETKAVIEWVAAHPPRGILAIHSIDQDRYCNNYDGPARRWAERLGRHNGYPLRASIGYPTPGSLGTWAGRERRIPTITLELPSRLSPQRCWLDNREGLLALCGG